MTPGQKLPEEGRVFSLHQLPPGFLRSLDNPTRPPAPPRPSATLVLLGEGKTGLEVLLLERSHRSRFIPGAWVFPGGAVDQEDADPSILPRIHGITLESTEDRLRPRDPGPPAPAYWVAALRETFEETGILLHRSESGRNPAPSRQRDAQGLARSRLLAGEMSFKEVLESLDLTLDAGALEYTGHWLTPECEPRRYETRFFAAEIGRDALVSPFQAELVDARWITPAAALERNRQGGFPLVFPTLFTLEELEPFRTPREALDHLRQIPVPRRLPKLERTQGGISLRLGI